MDIIKLEIKKIKPIISYGFLCLRIINNQIKLLLIQRCHSYEFVNFIIGKYNINDGKYIINMFRNITPDEKNKLLTLPFNELWNEVWYDPEYETVKKKYKKSLNKFEYIKYGYINTEGIWLQLENLINRNKSVFNEPNWGFPKGRKDNNEDYYSCAMRELYEETNLEERDYIYLDKIYPLFEKYVGTDGLLYKHIYYVCLITNDNNIKIDINNKHQTTEIRDIKFLTPKECIDKAHYTYYQKRKMLTKLHDIINNKYPELSHYNFIL